ncbi:hypothetical protein NPA08_04510 [Mycoplasmopsis citelli]|uniref:hypothetical protein n=1 Tax=Mycoplasmopsis citelli TaxID=171281 RepID=UPI00211423AB|nr:hypothetical protein [Mycoplasmopsis citelli]UUD36183.1 hypothetical protein NPA08_04510 [Mycoplasmopsis citelli]
MNNTKEQMIEHLIYKYEINEEYLHSLSDEQIKNLYQQKEHESLILAKNPNKFFYLKSLPVPKEVKTKTSSKAGKWIFLAFIIMLILLFTLFMLVAFLNN